MITVGALALEKGVREAGHEHSVLSCFFRTKPEQLARFRAGEREALTDVYRVYAPTIDVYLRRLAFAAGRRECDSGVLSDIRQETFTRAFGDGARAAFDATRAYLPYLQTIARNCFLDWRRSLRREQLRCGEFDLVFACATTERPTEDIDPLIWNVVNHYLTGLSPELREVYEARYVRDCSQADAAGVLGLSRRRLRTAEEQLRKGLRKAFQHAGMRRSELSASGTSRGSH